MLGGSATLADGTTGAVVNLASTLDGLRGSTSDGPVVAAAVGDRIWMLRQGATYATIRNAHTGEVVQKVDILDQGLAIAAVPTAQGGPFRVWISTITGKMYIFGEEGTLIGLLQAGDLPVATRLFPMPIEAGSILLSSSPGKDVALWDTNKFTVIRSFLGRSAGEVTTDVVALDGQCSLVAISTTLSIRLWARQQGSVMCELPDVGASCMCADYSFSPRPYEGSGGQGGTLGGYLWTAQRSVVTVFAVVALKTASALGPTIQLVKERVLPCPNACQLIRTTPQHITAIDASGLVSVWSVDDFGPVRTFNADAFIAKRQPAEQSNGSNPTARPYLIVPAATRATRLCWTFGPDERALLWSDESALVGPAATQLTIGEGAARPQSSSQQPGAAQVGPSKDMEKEEITFLRRKLKYMETMATLYRQKVGVLFREGGAPMLQQRAAADGDASRVVRTFNEIDSAYSDALSRYEQQTLEQEPLPGYLVGDNSGDGMPTPSAPAEDFVDYWRRKYQECRSDMQRLKDEYESMMELFFIGGTAGAPAEGAGELVVRSPKGRLLSVAGVGSNLQSEVDVRRAHHVCQLIKEKNAVRERERQLLEDVSRLRAKLREFNSPLASRGPLEDAETLKQQNTVLREELKTVRTALDAAQSQAQQLQTQAKQAALIKGRLAKMQAAVDEAEIKLSNRTAEMQSDIDGVLEKFYAAQRTIDKHTAIVKAAQNGRHEAELKTLQHQQTIEALQERIGDLEAQLVRQRDADGDVTDRLRDEIAQLCDAIGDREAKLVEWQNKHEEATMRLRDAEVEASSLRFLVESKDTEISVLMERVAHLESVIQERRMYAQTIAEVQGRMELIIEELRHAFTPSEFAASMGKLEDRMANLIAVEQQLRHKDDIIAMRDDDIRLLRESAAQLEAHVGTISSVFLQLPQSVDEVEALLVELDEYRRRLGVDTNVQAAVRQRLLDLHAKKKANEEISGVDMDLLLKTGMGYNDRYGKQPDTEALQKAKVLADALKAVAASATRDSKTGLVGATPSIPYSLNPVHQHRSLPPYEAPPAPDTEAGGAAPDPVPASDEASQADNAPIVLSP